MSEHTIQAIRPQRPGIIATIYRGLALHNLYPTAKMRHDKQESSC